MMSAGTRVFTCLLICLVLPAQAQIAPLPVRKAQGGTGIGAYEPTLIPHIRWQNSDRLYQLIRAGKLYLTVQDAIALAIENNLSLEVSRYGPLNAEWNLFRAEAGGPLRGVTSGSSQIGQVASGQGVSGSQAAGGAGGGGGGAGGGGGTGGTISQIGPVTQNLDPVLRNTTVFSHTTYPQINTRQSRTTALVDSARIYNTSIQQGLLTGGYASWQFNQSYLKQNAPTNILNPSVAPRMYLFLQHNLLQGFGKDVNSRFIRVAQKNVRGADYSFESQLIDQVVSILNLYWGLVVDIESLKSRQRALDLATRFQTDTRKTIDVGKLPSVDIYRAEVEVGTRTREYSAALAAVRQRENTLKNALSRTGMEDPALDTVEVIPVDSLQVPEQEELPPLREMVATAMRKRPDVYASRLRQENAEISALGTASGILPQLVGITQFYSSGLAGTAQPFQGIGPNPDLVGGLPTALAQIFRGAFSNGRGTVFLQGRIHNRINQADYGVDQLQLRQSELTSLRDLNQMVVDISNQVVALRQARARYSAALNTRLLQQELLQKQQFLFNLGTSTINDVINAQRSLVTAESSEVAALGSYVRARIGLDQILGETLEKNRISVTDALKGQVSP
jgi:outer membrane protein